MLPNVKAQVVRIEYSYKHVYCICTLYTTAVKFVFLVRCYKTVKNM